MSYAGRAVRAVRTLSAAERRKVLETIGKHRDGFRDYVIVSFALGTGTRENEIAALDVGDVATSPREIRSRVELRTFANKGRKSKAAARPGKRPAKPQTQRIFLGKSVRRLLLKYVGWKKRNGEPVALDAPLFVAGVSSRAVGDHPRLSTRAMRRMWRLWQVRAGFTAPFFTFHELRHTFATLLYAKTKDPFLVQRAIRHRDVTTTQIYTHVSDDELRRALEEQPA